MNISGLWRTVIIIYIAIFPSMALSKDNKNTINCEDQVKNGLSSGSRNFIDNMGYLHCDNWIVTVGAYCRIPASSPLSVFGMLAQGVREIQRVRDETYMYCVNGTKTLASEAKQNKKVKKVIVNKVERP